MGKYFKIEFFAIVMISIMLGVSYLIKVKNEKMNQNAFAKELEIYDSLTVEVNASSVISKLYADRTVRENGIMKLYNLTYQGKSAKELKSKYGRSIKMALFLDENITLLQDNGYYYEGDHAIYDKKVETLYVTSPFVAYIQGGNIIHGVTMRYDTRKKVVAATNVDAVFFTKE